MSLSDSIVPFVAAQAAAPGSVCRGVIEALLEGGEVFVAIASDPPLRVLCDVLRVSAESTLVLSPGTNVLVLLPAGEDSLGCVLGAVGPYAAPAGANKASRQVIVAAENELSLTCGQSSLTLKADGKVLLQGVDIVTKAKRNHKIKAGTVAIN